MKTLDKILILAFASFTGSAVFCYTLDWYLSALAFALGLIYGDLIIQAHPLKK